MTGLNLDIVQFKTEAIKKLIKLALLTIGVLSCVIGMSVLDTVPCVGRYVSHDLDHWKQRNIICLKYLYSHYTGVRLSYDIYGVLFVCFLLSFDIVVYPIFSLQLTGVAAPRPGLEADSGMASSTSAAL